MKSLLLILSFCILSVTTATAYCPDGWCWGDDPGASKEQYVVFSDYHKYEEYEKALPALRWLIENVPNLHENLYIQGAKVYDELIEKGGKPTEIAQLKAEALVLYDLRVKHFGNEADVLNRKGLYAFRYLAPDKKWDELYPLYKQIFALNRGNTAKTNMLYLIKLAAIQNKRKKIADAELSEQYVAVSAAIADNADKDADPQWAKLQRNIDQAVAGKVVVSCEQLENRFAAPVQAGTATENQLKQLVQLMSQSGCTDNALFLKGLTQLHTQNPKGQWAGLLYKIYMKDGNYTEALNWVQKAQLASELTRKEVAELQLDEAKLLNQAGKAEAARAKAKQAAGAIPQKAYSLLADLYFSATTLCDETNPFKQRLVFLIAHNYYEKAGNTTGMKRAAEQFPSPSELHTLGLAPGDTYSFECVAEEVIIRTR